VQLSFSAGMTPQRAGTGLRQKLAGQGWTAREFEETVLPIFFPGCSGRRFGAQYVLRIPATKPPFDPLWPVRIDPSRIRN